MTRAGLVLCVAVALLASGCARRGKADFKLGRKAERLQDYDAAFDYYQRALKRNPEDAQYIVKFHRARFEASTQHIKQGLKLRERGDLQGAATEFQRALAIDPSSPAAEQELHKTVALLNEKERAADAAAQPPHPESHQEGLASGPPQLKPLDGGPINLHMINTDFKVVYETIAKLAGITVVFDPELQAGKSIRADLNNLTLEQALEVVALESKTFWKPVTENIIFVAQDTTAKRRDYDEEVVRTFYLANTVQPTDLTEIVTGLRQLLDLHHIQQLNAQNAIVMRDTPDKIAVAEKMIEDSDKARPEVVIQVNVVEARADRRRNLGIQPGQSAALQVVQPGAASSSSTTTNNQLTFENLRRLRGSNYSVTVPSFTANALLSDSTTRIIQNPEIRSVDGQSAKLRIGDRVPIATGSFSSGIGLTGTAGGFGNPLVNTQFQYQEVGVNIDITPRVHPDREVSLKVSVEVSSVTGTSNLGGIQQPIISQRKIDHEIRLKEGEANILGGLITRTDAKTLSGWPGLAKIPLLRYFLSDETHDTTDDEILIIMTPHIVRLPDWTRANLRPLYSGSESEVKVLRESEVRAPKPGPTPAGAAPGAQSPSQKPGAAPAGPEQPTSSPQIRFEPRSTALKVGQTQTIGVVVESVNDLFSIPMLLQYNPSVISIEDIQHGNFLSGGNQEIAIVYHDDKQHGQTIVSATRQPNTAGVNGTGTILGVVVKGIAPGTATLSIVQVNAKDSQQRTIQLVTSEATVQVQR